VNTAAADKALEPILKDASADPIALEALLAGFSGHEAEFIAWRIALPRWEKPEPWRQQLLKTTAGLMWRQRRPLSVLRLLDVASRQPPQQAWQQVAILEGLTTPPPVRPAEPRRGYSGGGFGGTNVRPSFPRMINLPTAPQSLELLRKSANLEVAAAAEKVARQLNWPGKDGKPLPVPPPLTASQQALYDVGHKEFMNICAACHNPSGFGEAGKGPSLIDSEWLGDDERVIRLVLLGARGPVTIGGEVFNRDGVLEMPGMYQALDDQKIAGVLTFARREWREKAPPVDPQTVARIRAALGGRTDQWTARELLQFK
jgi:mono/diheme cytochrome c family protein